MTKTLTLDTSLSAIPYLRDGPLEKLWAEANFRAAGIFFFRYQILALYEFFLGNSMHIFWINRRTRFFAI